jgi:F-type H+-transporting ATPase subunit b
MSILFTLLASEAGAPTYQTHSAIFPETAEIIYGGLASILVFSALGKFGLPMVKKSLAARTERIQTELDNASQLKADADSEASRIRGALGDIQGERSRLLAEADAQAAALISEGRARIEAEAAELEAKATSELANAGNRVQAELRNEIVRLSNIAVDAVVKNSVNAAAQQDLIEQFISNVGAAR